MLNIFEKFAPRWRNAVARYAKAVWTGKVSVYADWNYNKQAGVFSREYRHAMEKHYAEKGMKVYRGTLDGYVNEWLNKQQALKDTLKQVATEKQDNLVKKALEELKSTKDAQKAIDKIFGAKENEEVYKVFSFKDNFEKYARQQGDEEAYNLGTGMNEGIIKQYSDRYFWKTQKDKKVRPTHEMLQGKCFLFSDPPTTIDKYGNRYTGNPGTDYGCVPEGTLIRLNSDVIRCFRRKFTGELTSIITESGITLRATRNHPILTNRGWQPVHLVNIGDYVVKVPDKSLESVEPDVYNIGIPIEQIFDFFSLCGEHESIPGSTSQFHGDGIPEEKVDVITTNWELTDKRDIETGEILRKLIFSDTDMVPSEFFGLSDSEFNSLLFWLGLSSLGDISSGRNLFSLFGGGVLKADDIGLTAIPRSNPAFNDKSFYKVPGTGLIEIFSGTCDGAHPGEITFNDLIFERVVAVDTVISDCHVYNLQTSTNWYIANGLSTHNCRCWAECAPEREKVLKHYTVRESQRHKK